MLALIFALALQTAPAEPPARNIDDLDDPLTGAVPQGSYEQGLRGAFSRSQSLKGPLDGGWVVSDAAGAPLYRLQLVDPGFAGATLEGVWADLRQPSGIDARGFLSAIRREGAGLHLQFAHGREVVSMKLDPTTAGGFAGELAAGADRRRVVVSRR